MKERRVRCPLCGQRFTEVRFERERPSVYCERCREERQRAQARARMQLMRDRRRAQTRHTGAQQGTDDRV